jgi:hypothetical protein
MHSQLSHPKTPSTIFVIVAMAYDYYENALAVAKLARPSAFHKHAVTVHAD